MMTKQEAQHRAHVERALSIYGVSDDAQAAMRRISNALHRWHERECNGDVERDEATGAPYAVTPSGRRYSVADLETGALKRLAKLAALYPDLILYVQGDPRGAALYVLRRSDVPDGENVDAYYSRGVAIY